MAISRVIEEESGTTTGRIHAHNGYYAGDFSSPRRTAAGHEPRPHRAADHHQELTYLRTLAFYAMR
jgi:hypothetical protein